MQLIAVFILAAAVAAKSPSNCQYLLTDDQSRQLLISDGGRVRPLFEDADGVHHARWSPDGRSVAYVTDFKEYPGDVVAFVVVRDLSTLATKRMPLNLDEHVIEVQQLGWKGRDRVWIEGRFGRRSGTYIEWNVSDEKRTKELLGTKFSYSAAGVLAYVDHDPAPTSEALAILVAGDRRVYETRAKIRFLAWSPDGSAIGLVEEIDGAQRLRIVSLDGKVLQTRERLSIVPESIAWSSASRVTIGNSKESFAMSTESSAMKRSAGGMKGLIAHDLIECDRSGHARRLTAVDVRCNAHSVSCGIPCRTNFKPRSGDISNQANAGRLARFEMPPLPRLGATGYSRLGLEDSRVFCELGVEICPIRAKFGQVWSVPHSARRDATPSRAHIGGVTRHTCGVTRHTGRVTRHTGRVTRHTGPSNATHRQSNATHRLSNATHRLSNATPLRSNATHRRSNTTRRAVGRDTRS